MRVFNSLIVFWAINVALLIHQVNAGTIPSHFYIPTGQQSGFLSAGSYNLFNSGFGFSLQQHYFGTDGSLSASYDEPLNNATAATKFRIQDGDIGTYTEVYGSYGDGAFGSAFGQWNDWVYAVMPTDPLAPEAPQQLTMRFTLALDARLQLQGSGTDGTAAAFGQITVKAADVYGVQVERSYQYEDNPLSIGAFSWTAPTFQEFAFFNDQIPFDVVLDRINDGDTTHAYYASEFRYSLLTEASIGTINLIQGRQITNAWNTISLQSVLLPDGTTPESQNISFQFSSGMPLPNALSTPEPSSLTLAGLGFAGTITSLFFRRHKAKANSSR